MANARQITLVLGGARSGKTRFALRQAERIAEQRYYLATAQAHDDEMADRIRHHKAERGAGWQTIEEPLLVANAIGRLDDRQAVVLVDCLTLWLSNHMFSGHDLPQETDKLVAALQQAQLPVVLVSNEVGLGIVPENALARRFRDAQGWLNQAVAEAADRVVFVAAGLPLWLKGGP
jgi:adenosylcobinamide kinase / adenosylcobinamide-phosphate guanylyltransferase